MPKLTCLMFTYNKEKDIAKAIESVLMQKTKFEYKLLIIDDCSTDNSLQIAQEYEKKYPDKISIVCNEKNLGLLKTTYKGYSLLGDSQYYCVLDPDDWYTYDLKFEDAISYLEEHPEYSCYSANILLHTKNSDRPWLKSRKKEIVQDYKNAKAGRSVFMQTSGSIFRNIFLLPNIKNRIENIMELPFPESFRADVFRQELALTVGKMYVKNQIQSVYNYNEQGEYSSQTEAEQEFNLIISFYSFAHFFVEEKDYYMNEFFRRIKLHRLKYGNECINKKKDIWLKLIDYMYNSADEQLLLIPTAPSTSSIQIICTRKTSIFDHLMLKIYDLLHKKLLKKGCIND